MLRTTREYPVRGRRTKGRHTIDSGTALRSMADGDRDKIDTRVSWARRRQPPDKVDSTRGGGGAACVKAREYVRSSTST